MEKVVVVVVVRGGGIVAQGRQGVVEGVCGRAMWSRAWLQGQRSSEVASTSRPELNWRQRQRGRAVDWRRGWMGLL